MSVKTVFLDCVLLGGKPVIQVGFEYDPEIIRKIKTVQGARWRPGERKWLVPESDGRLQDLKELLSEYEIVQQALWREYDQILCGWDKDFYAFYGWQNPIRGHTG